MFYSAITGGFYTREIHGQSIPADAVGITVAEHAALMEGQSIGRQIITGPGGKPILTELVPPTLEDVRGAALKSLADWRFERETGGVIVNGATIKTDRESQATITGAWVRVQQAPGITIDFKGANGWIAIGKAEVEAIALVAGAHVQACFSNEKAHALAIAALNTAEDIEAYDITTGWPAVAV